MGAMMGGHYTTGSTNEKEGDLVHNVQRTYKKRMRNLKGKNKEKWETILQSSKLRQLKLPHSGQEFLIGYRE